MLMKYLWATKHDVNKSSQFVTARLSVKLFLDILSDKRKQ